MNAATVGLMVLLSVTGPRDQSASSSRAKCAIVSHCLVSAIEDVAVPAEETGTLTTIAVDEGARVEEGQLLAQIDDRIAKLEKFAAEKKRDAVLARATDDIDIQYATASLDVADAELAENLDINRRSPGSVPDSEIRRLQLARRRAELQIGKSRLDMKVAAITAEVEAAIVQGIEESIARRKILSPTSGIVLSLLHERGEWVNAGETLARLVRMDRLRVEGFLNADQHDPARMQGREVSVEIQLPEGGRATFAGKVVFVSPLNQAGNKYRVRAEVDNRLVGGNWTLRPGMEAVMTIRLQ